MQQSASPIFSLTHNPPRCFESPCNTFTVDGESASPATIRNLLSAIELYFSMTSIPTPLRPVSRQATKLLPVPRKGSTTVSPLVVKKRMNSFARDSGNEAGWRIFAFARRSGLWMNQDLVNLIHSRPVRSLSVLWGLSLASVFCILEQLSVSHTGKVYTTASPPSPPI